MVKVKDNPKTLEIYTNEMEMYLDEFCRDESNNIENMKKESQGVWNAALMYIQRNVFINNKSARENCNVDYGNSDMLLCICSYYIYLCYKYDKEISIAGFSKLTGISSDTIYSWGNGEYRPSTANSDIYKMLHSEREESLSAKLISSKNNPLGILAALNHHYGWKTENPIEPQQRPVISADHLPRLDMEENI